MRQDQWIQEKLKYVAPDVIAKRDREYIRKTGCPPRFCVFIQARIKRRDGETVETVCGRTFRLHNMDSYFYQNDERRKMQMEA